MTGIPHLDAAVAVEPLTGGTHHTGWLATHADGSVYAVKSTPDLPPDMFEAEAEGLDVLRNSGAISTPRVVDVGADFLVLEALRPAPDAADARFWEETGRALARLHLVRGDRFGWHRDNWLGPLRQFNAWTEDGHEFFARQRILRFLPEPEVAATLVAAERAAVERICDRLPELVPPAAPVLTHGDLWFGNILATPGGAPALIDPAVSWNWPGTDLSMMLFSGPPIPDRCFAAYHELCPPEPGWREHLALLHLRELLCLLSLGQTEAVRPLRSLLRRYA